MSTKKVEVWSHRHSYRGEWIVDERPHETLINGTQKAATLVIHEGEHEPVYTRSEVREMLNGVAEVVGIGGRAVIEHGSDTEIDKWAKALDKLRSSVNGFGILNPA